MLRDAFHQDAVHGGVAPYKPNSLDGGCPFFAGAPRDRAFIDVPARVAESVKTREAPASYSDHFSQVRQFWLSMTPPEQEHIVTAYTFELAKCFEQAIKQRQLLALANIDPDLCARVAEGLGLPAPEPTETLLEPDASPALSQIGDTWPTDGRVIGILVDPDGDLSGLDDLRAAVSAAHMVPLVVTPVGGALRDGTTVQRTFAATRSVECTTLSWSPAAPVLVPTRSWSATPKTVRTHPRSSTRAWSSCSRSASDTRRRSARGVRVPPRPISPGSPRHPAS